ncbi:probable sodium/metabolite cotransporter BASS4, chloroplastic isoform X2 [Malus sylvestris]|uniref:probable sodium/metabolite cotransporter BASS4, chloroplastic isoform X2 n=1 Tax=Malus sylvestris TaxID=3752 RepID=UPI0021AD4C09|nr:probable sodium/metabolite cotransporter BASS4, chloroplastic isoform X2 [Malus sylvestris]
MAGTIQALILTPRPANPLPFAHRLPHFPSKHAAFRFDLQLNRCISNPVKAWQHPDQKDGNGIKRHSGSVKGLNWAKPLSNFVANNFLSLVLVGGAALGLANPSLGCLADSYSFTKFSTFGVFIISGLTLQTREIFEAAEAWPVGIFGLFPATSVAFETISGQTTASWPAFKFPATSVTFEAFSGQTTTIQTSREVSILLFTPCFSRAMLQLPLQPKEFVRGLALFCCMPTTLSVAVALTQIAGGNSALALAMTVSSNVLGILVVPFSISKFVADGFGVSVPTKQLFKSLVLTLLIPLILGNICRESLRGDCPNNLRSNRKDCWHNWNNCSISRKVEMRLLQWRRMMNI